MPDPMRFLMIGGFLGAGKTTTIGRLAAMYRAQGLDVGAVTNDQAAGLVDTKLLRAQGHHVGEVAGSCFCCNFNELTRAVAELGAVRRPDIVLAEPVGSCTDLVATVAQPLMRLYADEFHVGPYAVILKPSQGETILKKQSGGFSPQAEYIFRKQLEEADLLLLNRIDELSAARADELEGLLTESFDGRPVLRISARTGAGFDALIEALAAPGEHCGQILELDYDVYAEGEAELGWLNGEVVVNSSSDFDLDGLLLRLIEVIRQSVLAAGAEVAHLKLIGTSDRAHSVVNLVSSESDVTLSLPSQARVQRANVVINARVAADPEALRAIVETALDSVASDVGLQVAVPTMRSFRPGRPVPTHRFAV